MSPEQSTDYGTIVHEERDLNEKFSLRKKICCCIPDWGIDEIKRVLVLAWPNILTSLLQFGLAPVSLIFCGRLGTLALDGVSLSNSMINVCGMSIGGGFTTASDTLFSQTFGSSNKKKVGIYLQRSLLVMFLYLVPCWMIFLNLEIILVALGQQPDISKIAGDYALYFMPALPFHFSFMILVKYLQNQNIVYPCPIFGLVGLITNTLGHYILLDVVGMDTRGSAIAQVIGAFSMMMSSIIYILVTKMYEKTWPGWSMDAFNGWYDMVRLGIPGVCMVGLELWSFEIGTFLTGLLGEIQLAAQGIAFQVIAIAFKIPLGLGIATQIRVGNNLGAGDHIGAKRSSQTGLVITAITNFISGLLLVSIRWEIPRIFSDDPDVIKYTANIIPIIALLQIPDGIGGTIGGILRGCGKQASGAVVIFIGYFIVGLPIGIPLMFLTKAESSGLWWGLTIGVTIQACGYIFILTRTKWEDQVKEARSRSRTKSHLEDTGSYDAETQSFDGPQTNIDDKTAVLAANSREDIALCQDDDPRDVKFARNVIFQRILTIIIYTLLLILGVYIHMSVKAADIVPIVPVTLPTNSSSLTTSFV